MRIEDREWRMEKKRDVGFLSIFDLSSSIFYPRSSIFYPRSSLRRG
jgi:hypothetical protein